MKRIILILVGLVAFSVSARELKNDTIKIGDSQMILTLPKVAIEMAQTDIYPGGLYKIYPLDLISGSSIMVHYGEPVLMAMPIKDNEKVIYYCKLGNVAISEHTVTDGIYYRCDTYIKYKVKVMFNGVTEENLKTAKAILDNLKIF